MYLSLSVSVWRCVVSGVQCACFLYVQCACVCVMCRVCTCTHSIYRPNGVRFVAPAGTTEFARRWNPQPGAIVSFKHRGYMFASKKPKMPTLYRIRDDMSWDTVVYNWNEKVPASTGFFYLKQSPLLLKGIFVHHSKTNQKRPSSEGKEILGEYQQ